MIYLRMWKRVKNTRFTYCYVVWLAKSWKSTEVNAKKVFLSSRKKENQISRNRKFSLWLVILTISMFVRATTNDIKYHKAYVVSCHAMTQPCAMNRRGKKKQMYSNSEEKKTRYAMNVNKGTQNCHKTQIKWNELIFLLCEW